MGARGERTIQAGAREVTVLFTNRALADAEAQLGRGLLEVLEGFSSGKGGISEVAMLLRAGMEAARRDARLGGKPVQIGDAYDVLDEAGFAAVTQAVMEAVAAVLTWGQVIASEMAGDDGDERADPN